MWTKARMRHNVGRVWAAASPALAAPNQISSSGKQPWRQTKVADAYINATAPLQQAKFPQFKAAKAGQPTVGQSDSTHVLPDTMTIDRTALDALDQALWWAEQGFPPTTCMIAMRVAWAGKRAPSWGDVVFAAEMTLRRIRKGRR